MATEYYLSLIISEFPPFDHPQEEDGRIYGHDKKCQFCRFYCGGTCRYKAYDHYKATKLCIIQCINSYASASDEELKLKHLLHAHGYYSTLWFNLSENTFTKNRHMEYLVNIIKNLAIAILGDLPECSEITSFHQHSDICIIYELLNIYDPSFYPPHPIY
jgi:hypothetical protein